MLRKENMIKLRNHGAATVTTVVSLMASGSVAMAENPIQTGLNTATPESAQKTIFANGGIFQTIVNALLFLVGAISVIMLIIGGIRYIVSAGDQNAVTGAKNTIMYALVGVVVAFVAWGAVNFILTRLDAAAS